MENNGAPQDPDIGIIVITAGEASNGVIEYPGNTGWDGKINGELAPNGSYSYVFAYNYMLNGEPKSDQIKGGFMLVK